MVPWVSAEDGPSVEEVCERFEIDERELAADLELLFMCGLYPFTPDTLIEADVVDGRVWIRFADTFQRPPAFTPEEAVSLVAAASAVLDLPEQIDGPSRDALASARAKLADTLGIDDEEIVDVDLAPAADDAIAMMRVATTDHRAVELDYYSFGRDAWSRRRMHPYRLFNAEGQWYVQALAVEAGGLRNFRLDRMRNIMLLEETFTAPNDPPSPQVYSARSSDPRLVIELEPSVRWVTEQYPSEEIEFLENGEIRVTLRVSERAWAERLLLRLGSHARVVDGDIDISVTAERILSHYEPVGP